MADEIRVPPEVLDTFLKIKHLVDHTVEQLQALPPLQLSASGTGSSTGTASLSIVSSVTAHADVVRATASIPTPTVTVTEEEVEVARKWVSKHSAAVSAVATMAFVAELEGLLQFIGRMRDLLP